MSDVSMRQMLESGVHFGHQTCYWSPKMAPYIYGERNNIHIINLELSLPMYREALKYVGGITAAGGVTLFVGTKRQAGSIVREHATRCGMPYVDKRWLGGMLTNYKTVSKSVDRLKEMDARSEDGSADRLIKNERVRFERARAKLHKSLAGIREMQGPPDCLFVIDVRHEYIAIQEANKLGIPVVAVVDTNCSPRGIDYVIPGNDDAIRAIRLYAEGVADTIVKVRSAMEESAAAALAPAPAPAIAAAAPLAEPEVVAEPATPESEAAAPLTEPEAAAPPAEPEAVTEPTTPEAEAAAPPTEPEAVTEPATPEPVAEAEVAAAPEPTAAPAPEEAKKETKAAEATEATEAKKKVAVKKRKILTKKTTVSKAASKKSSATKASATKASATKASTTKASTTKASTKSKSDEAAPDKTDAD